MNLPPALLERPVPRALVFIAVTTAIGLPLLFGRVIAGHDMFSYVLYASQVAANLVDGIALPAWGRDLNAGFGGPGLLFYPPLGLFLHGLGSAAGLPIPEWIGLVNWLFLLLSVFAMERALRASGLGAGATAGALVYVLAPYRSIDLYERAALAENQAFLWAALLLWALSAEEVPPLRRFVAVSLATGGLLLTNLPLAILLGGALALVGLPSLRGRSRLTAVVAGAVAAAGLAAFSLVPQLLSGRWIRTEIWFGSTARGYRPSENTLFSAAALDPDFNGRVSLALLATATVAVAAFFVAPPEAKRRAPVRAALLVSALSLLSTLPGAGRIWEALPVFSRLQFPWRAAAPLTLAAALLVASVSSIRWRRTLLAAMALAALPHVGARTVPRERLTPAAPPLSTAATGPAFPDPAAVDATRAGSPDWGVFLPNLADVWFLPKATPPATLRELLSGRPNPALDPVRSRAAAVAGDPSAGITVVRWGRDSGEITLRSSGGRLLWHQLAFPGFETTLDGHAIPNASDSATGLLSIEVPAGEHRAGWRWRPFPLLRAARAVSLASLVLVGLAAVIALRPAGNGPRSVRA